MAELYAYTLRAHTYRDTKSERRLDDVLDDGSGGDVLTTFDRAMAPGVEWPAPPSAGQADTRSSIHTVTTVSRPRGDPRVRYGHINVSRTTVAQDIERSRHQDQVEVDQDDRGHRRMFFWLAVPARGHTGLLLTERSGSYGIATTFWRDYLLHELRQDYPVNGHPSDVTFKLDPYIPKEPWQKYAEEGQGLEGAELVKILYEDREDKRQQNGIRRRRVGKVVTRVQRSVRPDTQAVVSVLRDKDPAAALELVGAEYFTGIDEFDTVTVHANFGGKVRPVKIERGKMTQLGHTIDFSQVKVDQRGYPNLDDMAKFAGDLATAIGSPLGF